MSDWDRLTRTHFWLETRQFLQELGAELPENGLVVNIGSHWESSTISIVHGRPDLLAFSIDPKPCKEGLENLKHYGCDNIIRILGKSQDVGKSWRWPIDLLYVDGDHSYKAVKEDIRLWLPWVKGTVCFHDYGTEHTPGVKRAVDEAMEGYEFLGRDRDEAERGVLVAYRQWAG